MIRRLTIVTQWYPPEQAPFGRMMQELAADLAARGWDVTVITGFPNHPGGEVFGGYRKRWCLEEWDQGIRVLRVWIATSKARSLASRLATFLSFTLTSTWRSLREPGGGVLFAVLQPLSVGFTLPVAARLRGRRLVFNLQDLHPDTQIRLGMVRNRTLIGALLWMERLAYRHCAALTCICEPFRAHSLARGAPAGRVEVIENWIDTMRVRPADTGVEIRRAAGIPEDAFVVLWAGTLGHVSGAEMVVETAAQLRTEPRIWFLVIGEGPLRDRLVEKARTLDLDNVRFLPFQPEGHLLAVQNAGNVSLVTLDSSFAQSSVPSKVLAYMAAGRAVVAAVAERSPTAALLEEAGCGRRVDPGDAVALAREIGALAADPVACRELGRRARIHAVERLSREAAVRRYDRLFLALLGGA